MSSDKTDPTSMNPRLVLICRPRIGVPHPAFAARPSCTTPQVGVEGRRLTGDRGELAGFRLRQGSLNLGFLFFYLPVVCTIRSRWGALGETRQRFPSTLIAGPVGSGSAVRRVSATSRSVSVGGMF